MRFLSYHSHFTSIADAKICLTFRNIRMSLDEIRIEILSRDIENVNG